MSKNTVVLGIEIEIIGQISVIFIAASYKTINHDAYVTAAIQVRHNSLPYDISEHLHVGGKR
ncbi:MAG: hypothetical protein ACE5R6_13785 [Candidatus Heimdallarchaeota archaeon]